MNALMINSARSEYIDKYVGIKFCFVFFLSVVIAYILLLFLYSTIFSYLCTVLYSIYFGITVNNALKLCYGCGNAIKNAIEIHIFDIKIDT